MREICDGALMVSVLVLGLGITLAAALGPAPSRAGSPVLVIAPPWGAGAADLVARAGGRVIGPVTAPFGALAVFEDARPAARLRDLGAWMARDARAMASLCGVNE